MKGRPPKPRNLKLLAGTARRDREQPMDGPAFDLVEGVPEPPDWLTVHAAAAWKGLAPMLHANGLLTEGSLIEFAVLCALSARVRQEFEAGISPKSALIAQFRGLCADFCLTPLAQVRAGAKLTGNGAAGNRFANNGTLNPFLQFKKDIPQ